MKTLITLMLLISLGACKKSQDSGSSKNPTPEPPIPPPTISSVAIVSSSIFGSNAIVDLVVTFNEPVKITGVPSLTLSVGGSPTSAYYQDKGEPYSLTHTFLYIVGDGHSGSIQITRLFIDLNGGSIRDSSGQDLVNTIPQEYRNFPNVKVDTTFPIISSVAKVSSATLFGHNAIVDLVATFNEPVKIAGVPSLTLSVGESPANADYQDKGESYSLTHTFRYTVEDGHSGSIQVTGLSVDLSNSISDEAENPTEGNIQAPLSVSGVTVDAIHPIISSVAKVSSATLFGSNAIVDLVVTFNEPVKITGVPSLTLSVGGSPASADYQDKGVSYSLTHTFRYTVEDGHSGSIQVTGLSVDLSNSISDEAENPTEGNIQAPLLVSGVTVDAIHPIISSVAKVSSATLFGPNAIVDLVATFNEPVKITGVPSLTLSVGGSPASADYQDKGVSYSLTHTFRYTVEDGHSGSIQVTGLSVDLSNSISDEAENPMEGNIQAPLSVSGVTVDTIPPTISSVAKVSSATLFGPNAIVDLVATFNEPVKIAGVPSLTLSVGGSPGSADYQDKGVSYSLTHTFRYIVGNGHNGSIQVTGLSVDLSNFISDEAENPTEGNIQAPLSVSGVTVDAIPIISSVATVSSSTLFSLNAIVDLVATFNEPVKIAGVPSLTLSVGGSPASADYQDKGESYSLTHTFRYIVGDGHSGSIQVTGLSVDASNSISDEAENPTEENIPAPLSVSGVTIEIRSCADTVASGFNGGDGSESSPYLICTYAQLHKMRDNLTAYYELGQDINANPSWSAGDNGCTAYDGSTVPTTTPCTGWVPVGNIELDKCDGETDDVCFQGHLDGGDHIISNLYLNISASNLGGLFGYTGSQSEISNMGLTNASVTVTSSTLSSYSGGLMGFNNAGTISNSYTTGEVTSVSSHSSYSGGLVGYNDQGTISNSYATGEVTSSSTSSYGGGLVGINEDGTISNSYATGAVDTPSSSSAYARSYGGGLVGNNTGTVSNSYATGELTSSAASSAAAGSVAAAYSYSGGLVGFNNKTISNSYATGDVISSAASAASASSAYSYSGGLVGYNNQRTISNSYATGGVTSSASASNSYSGGLVGRNHDGTISGTNYFVDSSGMNGLGSGTCSGTCTQKTLVQLQALTSTDVTDWSTDNWDFGTTTQLPRLKYAPTATYCSDNTYTTQQTCEDASESWVIEGCGGDTGVTCGDVISGQ